MVSFSSVPCFCLHASCKAASFGDVHSADPRACFFELLLFFIGRSPFCTSSAFFTASVPKKYNPAGDRPSHLISVIFRGVSVGPGRDGSATLEVRGFNPVPMEGLAKKSCAFLDRFTFTLAR